MIGDKIKQLRIEKEMSMTELAAQADVAKSYLSTIERNLQVNPSLQFLEKISRVLNVRVHELIEEVELGQTNEFDHDWVQIAKEAMTSGISKEEFKEFIEFNKWRSQKEKLSV